MFHFGGTGLVVRPRGLVTTAFAVGLTVAAFAVASPASASHIPIPTGCQPDANGANDQPGQKDVTQFCTSVGTSPFELYTSANWDETTLTGNNTADVCTLFNTDGDAFANLAICVTLKSSGTANGNLAILGSVRLFTCLDTKADRCTSPVQVTGTFNTNCEVSQKSTDPFGPAALNGPGTQYPVDTEILCEIDLADFGVAGTGATLLDGCSYPSAIPNSDPSDCILFKSCTSAANCDDDNPCTLDSCDVSGVCAHTPTAGIACTDGLYCNGDETCSSLGFCDVRTARSCDDGVACTVDSCDELGDTCVHSASNSLCSDGQYCNGVEICNAVTGCQAGTAPNCNDNVGCTADACDEVNDTCTHTTNNAACNDGLYCNGVETCDAVNGCVAGVAPNCTDSVACTTDSCNEATDSCDHAANDAACSNGLFCDGAETCDVVNGCQVGTPPNCSDAVACTVDSCNESTDTCDHARNNAACSDGQFCNGVETCDVLNGCRAGVPPACGDGVTCTVDTCNEATDSCDHAPNNAACSDGQFCNGVETCDVVNGCQAGAPPNCADAIACTVDSCNESTDSCDHTPNDSACGNGEFCDGIETCDALLGCQAGTPPNCADSVSCTTDSCNETTDTCDHTPNNSTCSDGQFCTGVEVCDVTNGCQPGVDPCPTLACDEGTDQCTGCATNADCDNSVFCDGAETCVSHVCTAATPVNCADAVSCTADSCNEATDSCDHVAGDAVCNDGLYCNGAEVCDAVLGCRAGTPPNCADAVACTADACNEATDSCDHTPNNALCGDGLYCNGTETCSASLGCQAGTPPNCNDGVICTNDSCNEATDSCSHLANNAACSDGQFCDGVETCDPSAGCLPGTAPNCNDGVNCTSDACDEVTDSCDHVLNDGACDDGRYCNGTETCTPAGCSAGSAPDCGDGVACTTDSCVEATDSCAHVPSDAACDDGMFCDGAETCDLLTGCKPGSGVVCPGDGFTCSVEGCDESSDACVTNFSPCICGDGEIVTPEECEPPVLAGTFEDCNNLIDDDGDGDVDCHDLDCAPGARGPLCDEACTLDIVCDKFKKDPAMLTFSRDGGPDALSLHGRFELTQSVDPYTEGLAFQIVNEYGPIYRVTVGYGELLGTRGGTRFKFRDNSAREYGADSVSGGLYRAVLVLRAFDGVPYVTFKIKVYADFSAATRPLMTTQLSVGTQVGSLTAEWTATGRGWKLPLTDY